MDTTETPASFCDRVLARTGVAIATIPDGTADDMLGGHIFARRGATVVVSRGYPDTDPETGAETYRDFRVIDRTSDLPACLAAIREDTRAMRYHTHIRYRRSTVDTVRFLDADDLDSAIAEWLKIGTNFPLIQGETEIARANCGRYDQYVISATGEVRQRYG